MCTMGSLRRKLDKQQDTIMRMIGCIVRFIQSQDAPPAEIEGNRPRAITARDVDEESWVKYVQSGEKTQLLNNFMQDQQNQNPTNQVNN